MQQSYLSSLNLINSTKINPNYLFLQSQMEFQQGLSPQIIQLFTQNILYCEKPNIFYSRIIQFFDKSDYNYSNDLLFILNFSQKTKQNLFDPFFNALLIYLSEQEALESCFEKSKINAFQLLNMCVCQDYARYLEKINECFLFNLGKY